MKKSILFVFLIFMLLLAACSTGQDTPTAAPTDVPPTEAPATEVPTTEEPTVAPDVEEVEPTAESITIEMGGLGDSTWAWIGFTDPTQQVAIENPLNYTLTFQHDGTVAVVADCNNAMGSYSTDGSSLNIEMGPMTMAACPEGSRSDDFVKYLGFAAIYFFEDGNLYIDLMADGGTMAFAPSEVVMADDGEGAIAGALWTNPWQWAAFTNPVDQYDVENSQNYLLTFNEDGTVNIVADCNNANGSYTADGSSLTIEIGPMTLAICPDGSRSDDFVKYLGSAAIYFYEEGDLFIDLMADGGTMRFSPYDESMAADMPAAEFSPDAEPIFASLELGGGETLWLDPTLVSVRSGTLEGPGLDAASLGANCTGIIPAQPDVVFNWDAHEGLEVLRVFSLSLGDPTLVLVTPSGEILCSDDFNPLVLDPFIEIKDPQVGRYAAFIGSFEKDAIEPGFLVVTGLELDPATMDLSQMFPRHIDPRATSETLSLDVLEIDSESALTPPNGSLSPADLVYQQELSGGGEIGAFNLDHENLLCTGFISAAPNFRFDWSGDLEQLVLFFESNQDTTLKVLAPDGTFHCDDDYHGSENLNPWLSIPPVDGTYNVWIGSFAPDVQVDGLLMITQDGEALPTPLTSKDLNN